MYAQAAGPIHKLDALCAVPNEVILIEPTHEETVLRLLQEQALGEKSFWFPYLQVHTGRVTSSVYFSASELRELEGSQAHFSTLWLRKEHFARYRRAKTMLPLLTHEQYVSAALLVNSRGFHIDDHGMALIPGYCYANFLKLSFGKPLFLEKLVRLAVE
jgi:hypothetical protein